AFAGAQFDRGFRVRQSLQYLRKCSVETLGLAHQGRTDSVSDSAKQGKTGKIHLCNRQSAVLSAKTRMSLNKCHRRFEQVGKKKREYQNEESAARQIENSRRDQEDCHRGDYISRSVVNGQHADILRHSGALLRRPLSALDPFGFFPK